MVDPAVAFLANRGHAEKSSASEPVPLFSIPALRILATRRTQDSLGLPEAAQGLAVMVGVRGKAHSGVRRAGFGHHYPRDRRVARLAVKPGTGCRDCATSFGF